MIRETRWLFWKRLAQIGLYHSQILDEYLWLLMLNEHFIDYQAVIRDQVEKQLSYQETMIRGAA